MMSEATEFPSYLPVSMSATQQLVLKVLLEIVVTDTLAQTIG